MRQILLNELNLDLRKIYFNVLMIDGITPALDEVGGQPEVNVNSTGWSSSNNISPLVSVGFGNYYGILTNDAVNQLGIILSHYKGNNTLDTNGEDIEVIQAYRDVEIFEEGDMTSTQSYATIAEADSYFATVLNSKVWDATSDNDKLKALVTATRDIDRLHFKGVKTSNYHATYEEFLATQKNPFIETQFLEFPRNGNTKIPEEIKIACCEIAGKYTSGVDIEAEYLSHNIISHSFTGISETFDRGFVNEAYMSGINSIRAWNYLRPFLADPYYLRIAKT